MRNTLLLLILSFTAFLWTVPTAAQATVEQNISASITQEYNDNINENSSPKTDFITTISPQYRMNYDSSRIKASLDYKGDFRKYDTGQDQDQLLNTFTAKATLETIKNLFFITLSDSNSIIFTNATQGETRPADATANQVNQNVLSADATFSPHFSDRTQTKFGYKYDQTNYGTLANNDSSGAVNKTAQSLFLNVLHELTPQFDAGFNTLAKLQTTDQGDQSQVTASAVGRYTYAEDCYFFLQAGATQSQYSSGDASLTPNWSAGVTHTFGKTAVMLETKGGFEENPSTSDSSFQTTYSATVTHDFKRAKLRLNAGYASYSGQDTQQSDSMTTTAQLDYELSERLTASITGSYVDTISSGSNSTRLYSTLQLSYQLPKDASLKVYYRNKNYDSDSASSYQVNIVGVSITKNF